MRLFGWTSVLAKGGGVDWFECSGHTRLPNKHRISQNSQAYNVDIN